MHFVGGIGIGIMFLHHSDVSPDDGGTIGIDVIGEEGVEGDSIVRQGGVHPVAVDNGE